MHSQPRMYVDDTSITYMSTLERNPIIEMNQFPIKQVPTSKSPGVYIDGNLSCECHINEISKEIASGISAIKRIRYVLPFEIPLNVQFTGTATLWLLQCSMGKLFREPIF